MISGFELKELRSISEMTQKEFGLAIGTRQSAISNAERKPDKAIPKSLEELVIRRFGDNALPDRKRHLKSLMEALPESRIEEAISYLEFLISRK